MRPGPVRGSIGPWASSRSPRPRTACGPSPRARRPSWSRWPGCRQGALERSGLDRETYLLVRLAALVATDAAPVSYSAHLDAPGGPGLPVAKIIGVFGAIAPLVGSARVLSAASRLDLAGLVPLGPRRITPSG